MSADAGSRLSAGQRGNIARDHANGIDDVPMRALVDEAQIEALTARLRDAELAALGSCQSCSFRFHRGFISLETWHDRRT